MKLTGPLLGVLVLLSTLSSLVGCTDPKAVLDESAEIANNNWQYGNKLKFDVPVEDANTEYNLYFNLRVTADYKYSNIFVILYESGTTFTKPKATRFEFKLASSSGEWLGKGSGSMYSYQIPFKTQYRFPAKGKYHFELEQNMRDNPLHAISDVGLRVEKAE
ncbi:gliding motility lipoprotein GldH [Mucilaginibacter robiniae]|uniref:Gliding motility lipoprotein GldH n=1 Tax=Mucilaginibacter robiniae TaxID=2728022 RepID=A0A7L5E000_9SPHI|nr:gliding motility lipoprotein GldH [Mucilaginibacter robiniae]QJD95818.1 gliding motility lipoprotein GldH [Mucilaginibacter robiniae]